MKKLTDLLIALVLITTIYSCTKSSSSSNSSSTSKQPFLQFNGNGVTYTCKAAWNPNDSTWDLGPSITKETTYGIWFNMMYGSNSGFFLWSSDTLKVGNLKVSRTDGSFNSVSYFNDRYNFADATGNYLNATGTITITRISNGTADGSFNAIAHGTKNVNGLPDTTGQTVMNITQGQFSNISIK